MVQQAGGTSAAYGDGSCGLVVDPGQREQARVLYRTVYAASEGFSSGWTGSVALNIPGTTTQAFKDATLLRINWVLYPPTLHMGTGDVDHTASTANLGAFYPANALWMLGPNGLPGYPATRENFDA